MNGASFDLAVLGSLTVDTIVTPSDQVFTELLGGSAAYAAAGARVWSESVGVVGRIGSDFPQAHLQTLERHGIDARWVRRLPESFGLNLFFAYEDGTTRTSPNPATAFLRIGKPMPKSLIGYQRPAEKDPVNSYPEWAPHPEDVPPGLEGIKGAHLASCPYASQCTTVDRLQALQVSKLSLDPDTAIMRERRTDLIRNLATGVGVLMPSEKQARNLLGPNAGDIWQLAERLLELGSRHVVIKRGPMGQCLLDGQTGERWLIPAYPSEVVDVTGAGHAYGGGFLAGWVATGSLLEAALAGTISASLAVEGSGPTYMLDSMPGLAESRRESLRSKAHRL